MTVWNEIPAAVRGAIERHAGPITGAESAHEGLNNDFAVIVHREGLSPVFVKGVQGVSKRMRWLRNEAEASHLARGLAPDVLFHADVEEGDWLVVGFEYVPGRPADLSPESSDLPLVSAVLDVISTLPGDTAQPLSRRWKSADWWARLADEFPDQVNGWDIATLASWNSKTSKAVEGDRLVHTDLHEEQIRIASVKSVKVIDWGWPSSGAPWVDTAFMVIRLVGAGHTPAEAERWAKTVPCFSGVGDHELNSFAAHVAGLWSYRSLTGGIPVHLASMARTYLSWRLS